MTAFLHAAPLAGRREEPPGDAPGYSARDHARRLGLTEAELVEMDEGIASARLRPDWPALLATLRTLGPTVARTCNEGAVLETIGIYPRLEGNAAFGLFAGKRSELRLRLAQWAGVWAVRQGGQTSLQMFGRDGAAIHKICLTGSSNRAGWVQLLEAHAAPGLPPPEFVAAADPAERAAGGENLVRPVAAGSVRSVLQAVADLRLPIDATVGNPGCTHAGKGLVVALRVSPPWLEACDPRSKLRLREGAIAEARMVVRRTEDGDVAVLEARSPAGALIATLSGRGGAEVAEERRWRAILDALPAGGSSCQTRTASLLPA